MKFEDGYTVKEWSKEMGLHRTTVYRWIKERKVKAYKINQKMGWRITTLPCHYAVYENMKLDKNGCMIS